MHEEHGYLFLSHIPYLKELSNHVGMTLLVGFLLIVTTFFARLQLSRAMKSQEGGLVPDSRLTYKNFFEMLAESLFHLVESVMGHHDAPKYFPMIGSLFLFIFTTNLLGVVPGFAPSTNNLNTTLALGFFVFIYYNFVGFRSNGLGYIKHFFGPVIWIAPLMFVIELVSHIARPVSLALRLRGNIEADHMVLGVFSALVPYFLPIVFYGLGLFVAFIQAFVFCLMTMVYISLSTSHDH
ncbi:MAG: F0F1 ATP synthase subunit A [Bdellovibrionia bacterium]